LDERTETGGRIDVLYTDLEKAFDRVRVQLNRVYSSWASVLSGSSQGSISGPLLFVVYINDLPCNKRLIARVNNGYWPAIPRVRYHQNPTQPNPSLSQPYLNISKGRGRAWVVVGAWVDYGKVIGRGKGRVGH